ncbi:MAG TPA: peptide deformylase [candidate division Zixibacteria bacterium]|nr:peptide deformylase [candidate division Zixibacteria bacterium]
MSDEYPSELKFCYWGNPMLRKKTNEVEEPESPETLEFVEKMREKMREHDGLGLAATQVNCDRRICLVAFPKEDDYSEVKALVNPVIIEKSDETELYEEGCLSFPGLYIKIERPVRLKVRAHIIGEGEVEISAEGLLAEVLSHEIDHLDGIVFIDHLPQIRRTLIAKELKRIAREYND